MEKELFVELLESVKQGAAIMKGEARHSRSAEFPESARCRLGEAERTQQKGEDKDYVVQSGGNSCRHVRAGFKPAPTMNTIGAGLFNKLKC